MTYSSVCVLTTIPSNRLLCLTKMHHPLLVIARHLCDQPNTPPSVLNATLQLIAEAKKAGYNSQLEFAYSIVSKKLK